MANEAGDIARQMAAAPKPQQDGNRENRKGRTLIPFVLSGFKLPTKAEAFKNDDGSTTQRMAYAIFKITGSEMLFNASIYRTENKAGDVDYSCSMPSSGKGFPRPVFTTDDPATQDAYNTFRIGIVREWATWAKKLNADGHTERPATGSNYRLSAKDLGL